MTVKKLVVLYIGIHKQNFKTLLIHHRILISAVKRSQLHMKPKQLE